MTRCWKNFSVVCTLDYHAVVTQSMLEHSDVLVGFRTYPHVDFKETGLRAARCLTDLLDRRLPPVKMLQKLPLVVPVENCETAAGPARFVIDRLAEWDRDVRVQAASVFFPQPWADVAEMGVSLLLCLAEEPGYSDRNLTRLPFAHIPPMTFPIRTDVSLEEHGTLTVTGP